MIYDLDAICFVDELQTETVMFRVSISVQVEMIISPGMVFMCLKCSYCSFVSVET